MTKKFRCGRLIQTKDGSIEEVNLKNGGGTRRCDWESDDMTLLDVYYRLLTLYQSHHLKSKAFLYDYKSTKINLKQYRTFAEYMDQNGLQRNSTVLYLCICEIDNTDRSRQIRINSFPSSREHDESTDRNNKSLSCEYSFLNSIDNLMKKIRELINNENKIFLELFEYISMIRAYVFSIILPLQQQIRQSNHVELRIYLNNFNRIYQIFPSTKTLIYQLKNNFCHVRLFSIIRSSFFLFYNNIQILRNQCLTIIEDQNKEINNNSFSLVRSSPEKSFDRETNKKLSLFQSSLKYFHHLLNLLKSTRLKSFQQLIYSSIEQIKSIEAKINLSDPLSLRDSKRIIRIIRDDLTQMSDKEDFNPAQSESDRILYESCGNSLKSIRILLTSLHTYELNIQHQK